MNFRQSALAAALASCMVMGSVPTPRLERKQPLVRKRLVERVQAQVPPERAQLLVPALPQPPVWLEPLRVWV